MDELEEDEEDGGEQNLDQDKDMDAMEEDEEDSAEQAFDEDEDMDGMEEADEQDGVHHVRDDPCPLDTIFFFIFRMGSFEAKGGCKPADEASATYGPFKGFESYEMKKPMKEHIELGHDGQEDEIELFFKENLVDDAGNSFLGFRFWLELADRVHPMYGWAKLRAVLEESPPAALSVAEEQRLNHNVAAAYTLWQLVEEDDDEKREDEKEDANEI